MVFSSFIHRLYLPADDFAVHVLWLGAGELVEEWFYVYLEVILLTPFVVAVYECHSVSLRFGFIKV